MTLIIFKFKANWFTLRVFSDRISIGVDQSEEAIGLTIYELTFVDIVLLIYKSSKTIWNASNGLTGIGTFPVSGDVKDLDLDILFPFN